MKKILLCAALLSAVLQLSFAGYVPPAEKLLDEVKVHPDRTSYAQWLWFQAPRVGRNTKAFYRYTFDLNEKVKTAWCYFTPDDSGFVSINGKSARQTKLDIKPFGLKCYKYDLTNDLWSGKNVLAATAHNGAGPGGIILIGEIHTVSGKVIKLASAPELFKASGKIVSNWNKLDFDDSSWQPAMSIANADSNPWFALAPGIWNVYGTAEERQARLDRIAGTFKNYPDLSKEKPAVAKVVYKGDMAAIDINGKLHAPFYYLVLRGVWYPNVADAMVKSYRSGVRIICYMVTSDQVMDPETLKFDFSSVDRDIKRILSLCPDTYIALNFRFNGMPEKWVKNHPDEMVKYASGKQPSREVDQIKNYRTVSCGSDIFRQFFAQSTSDFAKYVKGTDWGKRVVSVRTSFGVYGEWHYTGMQEDMPDVSQAMTRYFRRYLKNKYKTDAALAAAWRMPKVTLDTAWVPTAAERRGDGVYLRDFASKEKQVVDYYECHQDAIATMLLGGAGAIKKVSPNWLVGSYYGYVFNMSYPSEGQTLLLDKVLSSPDVDFLSAPYTYSSAARHPGGTGIQRSLADKARAHGKLALVELDVRTHKQTGGSIHNIKTESESVAVLQRDFAQAWVAGCGVQLLDLHAGSNIKNNSWFNSPGIQQVIHTSIKQWSGLFKENLRDRYDAVAVWNIKENIWHGLPTLAENFPLNYSLSNGFLNAIYRSGYAIDLKGMDEYLAAANRYKLVFFMNAFTLTDKQRAALKAKLRRDNSHAVFIYGAGAVSNSGISADGVTDLTGIKVNMELKPANFAVKYKNNLVYAGLPRKSSASPRFVVADPDAEILGSWVDGGKPAAALKQIGSRKVWYSAAPIINPYMIADICKQAKLHCYARTGVMMRTNGNIMLVHGGNKFDTVITFPGKVRKLTDLYTGKVLAQNSNKVQLQSPIVRTWAILIEN